MASMVSTHAFAVTTNCQCVDFVKNKISYKGSLTGCGTCAAQDAGKSLLSAGYRWYGAPAQGDVVIFQPSFKSIDGKGVDQTYGHIAFIDSASFDSSRKEWTIVFLGANQSAMSGNYAGRSEGNCDNVTLVKRVYKDFSDEKSRTLSFYRK